MIRVLNYAERNVWASDGNPITVPTNTSTAIIPDQTVHPKLTEIAFRTVQNVGANAMYYAFGQTVSPSNYHGVLQPGQQLDCSNSRLSVNAYATGGTTCAVCILFRNDNGRNNPVSSLNQ